MILRPIFTVVSGVSLPGYLLGGLFDHCDHLGTNLSLACLISTRLDLPRVTTATCYTLVVVISCFVGARKRFVMYLSLMLPLFRFLDSFNLLSGFPKLQPLEKQYLSVTYSAPTFCLCLSSASSLSLNG